MKKLDTILLVDDDETTNFFHKYILEGIHVANDIMEAMNGEEALAILSNPDLREKVDLVFLDMNMPIMNGFEFLDKCNNLPDKESLSCPVMMLTSSNHQADRTKASTYTNLTGYYTKPLTREMVESILNEHFPNYSA
ncbi:MAG: response regulator [Bacteroidia bacterium]|nr:response regulator [Bacteroidia bacterium]